MKFSKQMVVAGLVAGSTLLAPLSAEAFFGPFSWMRHGGWGGWNDYYYYPGWGYPYGGWGYPGWGYPGWGGYGYPYYGGGYPWW